MIVDDNYLRRNFREKLNVYIYIKEGEQNSWERGLKKRYNMYICKCIIGINGFETYPREKS